MSDTAGPLPHVCRPDTGGTNCVTCGRSLTDAGKPREVIELEKCGEQTYGDRVQAEIYRCVVPVNEQSVPGPFARKKMYVIEHAAYAELEREVERLREALEKIADPRKRDHGEPDLYTKYGCVMHIAEQALRGERA